MSNFVRMIVVSCAIALACLADFFPNSIAAQAQTAAADRPVPPRLSYARAQYLKRHPSELAALMARLPPHHKFASASAEEAPLPGPTVGGTWTKLKHNFPGPQGASGPHLMMDGTVLAQNYCSSDWYKLTPDINGSYEHGTWSKIASMPSNYTPLYYASQVLPDGRLIVNGGEYNENCVLGQESWTTLGAIYDPSANVWTPIPAPSGWTYIGDAQSVVLMNGDYMLADCCDTNNSGGGLEALWDPTTAIGTWTTTGAGKADANDEEGWSLLPNGNLITADAYVYLSTCGDNTELYDTNAGAWASAGNSPVQLSDCSGASPSYEVGPQVLRPNGTVVMFSGTATGAASGTAIYNSTTGTLAQGGNVPKVGGAYYTLADAPAALESNGKLLFAASPSAEGFPKPTHFFEYSTNNAAQRITHDPTGVSGNNSYVYNLLVIPTGEILETDQTGTVQLYTPVGGPPVGVAPVITSVPKTLKRGVTNTIAGKQLNGLSEAGGYGDDVQTTTDYPLIRVKNDKTGHVFYCVTTGQSSRDIARGAATTATFVVPARVERGPSTLRVVTNGVASVARNVTIE
jgi:hypothetical protein